MKKAIFFLLILVFSFGCHSGPYELGYCKIYYDNLANLPGQSAVVNVIDKNLHSDRYTLTPGENSIQIYFDNGDFYHLKIDGLRVDSVHNIAIERYGRDNEKVENYSFMFNTSDHNQADNTIRINL